MTKHKRTGRALLGSALSLLLCISMLIGSTYAWFTDTASTAVNTIQSGTLDVALEMKVGNEWVSAEGQTLDFVKAEGHEGEAILWEPGCTYRLPELRIVNKGNLALKYKVIITGINGDAKLNEVIEWRIGDAALGTDLPLLPETNSVFTIEGHMKETAGNEYQNLTIEGISITVYATQYTYEYDSNGIDYDSGAEYLIPWDGSDAENTNVPAASQDGKIHISTPAELIAIMNTTQNVNSPYIGQTIVLDNNIDFGGHTVKGIGSDYANFAGTFDGQGYTISNFVINNTRDYYSGLFNQVSHGGTIKNLTVENATVIGNRMVGAIASNVEADAGYTAVVDNCHVKNCTIISNVKKAGAVVGYTKGSTVTNCSATNCAVVCKDSDVAESAEIVGYINSNSTVENNSFNNVTVSRGVEVSRVITTAEELVAFAADVNNYNRYSGKTVVLANDIDLNNIAWTPIGNVPADQSNPYFMGTFDGLGHTIYNLNVDMSDVAESGYTTAGLFGWIDAGRATIKNVNISGATVKGNHYTGALVGYFTGEIENCHVSNSTVISVAHDSDNDGDKVGGLVGYMNSNTTVKDSSVSNSSVIGKRDVGGLVGCTYNSTCTVSNNEVTNTTVTYQTANGNEIVGRLDGQGASNPCMPSNTTHTNVSVVSGATYVANGVIMNDADEYLISNAQGLVWCANAFNRADTTYNMVFKLTADIDMSGIEWTPWGNDQHYFNGLFDGQGHTISNLTITDNDTAENGHGVGFIGRLGSNGLGQNTIQNVTFDNANVSGHHWVGVAVGYNEFGKVDNVHVSNSRVTATCATTNPDLSPCGDKAGALIGMCGPNASYIAVSNCSATNCVVKAARDAAQLIGYGYTGSVYSNLSATNVTVTAEIGICMHSRKGTVSANALIGNGTAAGLTIN